MVLKVAVSPDLIHGAVDTGYGKVADAFRANFRRGAEFGAALAVYRDGVKVVDLWGGYRDGVARDPWRADTMVNMFSTTKGVAALVVALAVSRGLLSYDAKVADYWQKLIDAGQVSKLASFSDDWNKSFDDGQQWTWVSAVLRSLQGFRIPMTEPAFDWLVPEIRLNPEIAIVSATPSVSFTIFATRSTTSWVLTSEAASGS